MPSQKQCEIAKEITGCNSSDIEINVQCASISQTDRFLMSNSIEQILLSHGVSIERGWELCKDEIEALALDYLVNSAVAFCLYKDWKATQESKKHS